MSDLKEVVKWCLIGLVAIAILTVGIAGITMATQGTLYPWWLSIQRKAVEQSKSFTDANNNMLESYMLEHSRLDTKIVEANGNKSITQAYVAQQKAIVEKMCREVSTMAQGTVNPNTLSWLNSNGGCR
jgi:hypothetical protein